MVTEWRLVLGTYSLARHGSEASFRQVLNPPINLGFKLQLLSTTEGVFRCVRKIAKSDYWPRHVSLSVRKEQLGSHRTDFHIRYLRILRKAVQEIQVSLKPDKNKGYFTRLLILTAWCRVLLLSKIEPFMRYRGKILYSPEGHRWRYDACALHDGHLRPQIHTHTHTHTQVV
jgi:hypothetical protein